MSKNKIVKNRRPGSRWKPFFSAIGQLKLPWLWIIFAFLVNLGLTALTLQIPSVTSQLMLTGEGVAQAVRFYLLTGLIGFVQVGVQMQAEAHSVRKSRESLWNRMLNIDMSYYSLNDPQSMMSAVTTDLSQGIVQLIGFFIYFFPAIYYVVMAMRQIFNYHPLLMAACMTVVPLKYLAVWLLGRLYFKANVSCLDNIGELTGYLSERIGHMPLIKAYNNEEAERSLGHAVAQRLFGAQMGLVRVGNINEAVNTVFTILENFIVIMAAVVFLKQGLISFADWVAFFLFTQSLFSYIDQIFGYWLTVKGIQGMLARPVEIMAAPREDFSQPDKTPVPADDSLVFEKVSFSYPGADDAAVKDLSFTVPSGSSLAIIGLCGSGKTTAISLIERFFRPESGRILLGGVPVEEMELADYRRRFTYVQQGADIFSGSIRQAISYGIKRELTDEEILLACEHTGFDDYLRLHEAGLDAPVAPAGANMSGGQRQRLVLTRELLRAGDIVLLDEPTSALDAIASVEIKKLLNEMFADKTRLIITHDLSLIEDVDQILVLDKGEGIGIGTHRTLLKTCPHYCDMLAAIAQEKECSL